MNNRKVIIEDIKWYTHSDGTILPVLKLDKMYRMGNTTLDGVATTPKFLAFRKVGKQSLAYLKPEANSNNVTVIRTKPSNEPFDYTIAKCPSCGSDTSTVKENNNITITCTNKLCRAKARTPVYKLIKFALKDCSEIFTGLEIEDYLDNFKSSVSDEAYKITSLLELFYQYSSIKKSFNTTGRAECFSNQKLINLENTIVEYINQMPFIDFWTILGLHLGNDNSPLHLFSNLDYNMFLKSEDELNDHIKTVFKNDLDKLSSLTEVLFASKSIKYLVKAMNGIKS
jgi:hypothetical protein